MMAAAADYADARNPHTCGAVRMQVTTTRQLNKVNSAQCNTACTTCRAHLEDGLGCGVDGVLDAIQCGVESNVGHLAMEKKA